MKKEKMRSFLLGAISMLIMCMFIVPVYGEGIFKKIDAIVGGTKLFVDGKEKIFTNAKGDIVFPITIDGSTYIPVRGVADIFGKQVEWDGNSRTIYIGNNKDKNPIANLFDINKFLGSQEIKDIVKDNTNNAYREGKLFNDKGSSITYTLDKKYSRLRGTIALLDKSKNHDSECFVRIYCDDKLIYTTANMVAGAYPQDIIIDVKNVTTLKIVISNEDSANLIFSGFGLYN